MKKIFLLSILMAICCACDKENVEQEFKEQAPLTIWAYMIANNNLENPLLDNVKAMYHGMADLDKSATLLVYWDGKTAIGKNGDTHFLLRFETDGKGNINGIPALDESATMEEVLDMAEIVKEYPEQISTDKSVMIQVLEDMNRLTPTERVGFVAGSHATSWLKSIYARSFGIDGMYTSDERTMQISDMADALSSVGRKFDFLLFDACFMASIEVSYCFKDISTYQIASVGEVPAFGFPYDLILRDLYEGDEKGFRNVIEKYIDFYCQRAKQGFQGFGTAALLESKELQALVDALREEIVCHKDMLSNYDAGKLQCHATAVGEGITYDMLQFIKSLNDGIVPESFKNQFDRTVLSLKCVDIKEALPSNYGTDSSNFCGMGIYVPMPKYPTWNDFFKTLDWYTVSGWNEVSFSWNF